MAAQPSGLQRFRFFAKAVSARGRNIAQVIAIGDVVGKSLVANAIATGLLELAANDQIKATLSGRLLVDGLVLDFLSKSQA